ncbi:RNA-binding Musashi-like 2 isoform X1 [Sigmodon hispidus]
MEANGSPGTSGSTNDSQHDPGKMFIGGLSWQTSPDSLRDYFSKFGEIRECMVMRDPTTKRSRGFGFVTFADPASVDKVLGQPHHELDSKTIDPKVAFPRRAQPKMVTRTKKIFVGGLSANTVVEDVKQYFEQFGKVDLLELGPFNFPVGIYMKLQALQRKSPALVGMPLQAHREAFQYCVLSFASHMGPGLGKDVRL